MEDTAATARATSRIVTPVPFSGGDPAANLRVYEPDGAVVRFKKEWNFRDMPLGLHDPYDLEVQVTLRAQSCGGGAGGVAFADGPRFALVSVGGDRCVRAPRPPTRPSANA